VLFVFPEHDPAPGGVHALIGRARLSRGSAVRLIAELQRRRVFRVATAYLAVGLGVVYAADAILPRLQAPDWTVPAVIVLAGLGFFIAVALAWAFDVTPDGLLRTSAAAVLPEPAAPGHVMLPTHAPSLTTPAAGAPNGGAPAGPDAAGAAAATSSALAAPADAAAPDRRSIAVLPFENMSGDAENEYFSDGISEEIINALAQLAELRVAGRTSAFSFKGRHVDLREVGRQLHVGTVLEGSVRRAGTRVRITAQLIDCGDGYHLWSEKFDRDLHDIFLVQDEIAKAIAETLAVKLGARAALPLVTGHPDNAEAYQHFLRARHHVAQLMEPGFTLAVESYRAAVDLEPGYALAYAGLAECELTRGVVCDEPYAGSPHRARVAAQKALELDGGIAEAHAALGGVITFYDLDWDAAERCFLRAIELSPRSAWVRTWYGDLLAMSGRYDAAVAEAFRARELEPVAPLIAWNVIQNLILAGRLDDAEREIDAAEQLFPGLYFLLFFRGIAAWQRGRGDEAIAHLRACTEEMPLAAGFAGAACYHFGHTAEGDEVVAEMRARHLSAALFALVEVARGDTAAAIAHLREGRRRRDGFFVQFRASIQMLALPVAPELQAEMQRLGFR
jgi:adenylate cyclase